MSVTLALSDPTNCEIGVSSAATALQRSRIPALRKLRVDESIATVSISGQVATYHLKQLAQETIMPVLGTRELHNDVCVVQG